MSKIEPRQTISQWPKVPLYGPDALIWVQNKLQELKGDRARPYILCPEEHWELFVREVMDRLGEFDSPPLTKSNMRLYGMPVEEVVAGYDITTSGHYFVSSMTMADVRADQLRSEGYDPIIIGEEFVVRNDTIDN